MKIPFEIASIALSVVLIALVLLQAKGVGLGRSLGSTAYHSRRGVERIVFRATVLVAFLFCTLSVVAQLLIK